MLVYFAGCMATYRLPSIAESTIKILKHAGVDFKILGEDEWCCGSVALRTGYTDEAKYMARHNVDVLLEQSQSIIHQYWKKSFRLRSSIFQLCSKNSLRMVKSSFPKASQSQLHTMTPAMLVDTWESTTTREKLYRQSRMLN